MASVPQIDLTGLEKAAVVKVFIAVQIRVRHLFAFKLVLAGRLLLPCGFERVFALTTGSVLGN